MARRRAGNWEMNEWRSHETGSAEHGDDCPLLVLSCNLQLSTSGDILVLVLAGREVQLSPDAELLMTPWQVCHTAPYFSNIKARAQPARKTVFKCNIKIEAHSKKEARAKFDV